MALCICLCVVVMNGCVYENKLFAKQKSHQHATTERVLHEKWQYVMCDSKDYTIHRVELIR